MSEQPPSKFKMRIDDDSSEIDDDNSETLIEEALTDRRIDKLNSRLSWLAILIPVLVILIIVLAYLDLTNRVLRVHDTGSTEVQTLSENLQDRFSSLSVKQAKLEEIHKEMTVSVKQVREKVEKDLAALTTRIQETTENLGQTKNDGNVLKNALTDLKKALDPIRKDLETVSAALGTLDRKFNKELTQLNGSLADFNDAMTELNKRIDKKELQLQTLKKEIAALSSKKVEQRDIAAALDEGKKIYREMMNLIAKNLEGRLDDIEKEIEVIKRIAETAPAAIQRPNGSLPVNPEGVPWNPSADPESGEILEKSLQ